MKGNDRFGGMMENSFISHSSSLHRGKGKPVKRARSANVAGNGLGWMLDLRATLLRVVVNGRRFAPRDLERACRLVNRNPQSFTTGFARQCAVEKSSSVHF